MRALLRTVVAGLALVGVVALAAAVAVVGSGRSARPPAGPVERGVGALVDEAAIARAGVRSLRSPVTATPAVLVTARRAFARDCAICHGNDGAGAPLGRAMAPSVPDLRASTLDRTEGELFHAIRNGVRGSGMPALGAAGDPDADRRAWELVAFVRSLPELLEGELAEMEALNPRAPPAEEGSGEGEGHHHGHH